MPLPVLITRNLLISRYTGCTENPLCTIVGTKTAHFRRAQPTFRLLLEKHPLTLLLCSQDTWKEGFATLRQAP